MKKIRNTIAAGVGLTALALTNVTNAAPNFSNGSESKLATTDQSLPNLITNWITTLSWFLALIAVCISLWWAFNILTAAGDEDKVKTGKSIIIRACLWLVAIFLVTVIINFVIGFLFGKM